MGGCCGSFCRELDIRNFGLKYHNPKAFAISPALPLVAYVLFRALMGALWVYSLVQTAILHPTFNILLHFTYWSIFFVACYFVFGAIVSVCHLICKATPQEQYTFLTQDTSCALKPGEKDEDIPPGKLPRVNLLSWQHEVLWVFHTLAADTSLVMLVAYFSFWFEHRVTFEGYMEMMQHILPFLTMVVDCVLNGFPVRLLHVLYANIFGFAYVGFTLVYIVLEVPDLRGEPALYPSLEFSDRPVIYTAWLSVFILVGFIVAQFLFYLLYKLRTCLTTSGDDGKL